MSEQTTFTLNDKRLKDLIRTFKGKSAVAQVGILGDKNARMGEMTTNAEIGAAHEFGTSKLPMRSFLRMPLSLHLKSYLEKNGAFDRSTLETVIKGGSVVPWLEKVAITAEEVIQDAFNTGGWGNWKPSNMEYKKNKQTLIETQQLRNSISSRVDEVP